MAEKASNRKGKDTQKTEFDEILDRIADGFLSFDTEWRFTYLNPEGARTLGRAPEDLLGKNLWEEFPELAETDFGKTYLRAAAENTPLSHEGYYAPFDAWFLARAFPSATGLSLFFLNITERKRVEQERERIHRRFLLAEEAAGGFIYEWCLKTGEIERSRRLEDVLGYAVGEIPSDFDFWGTLIHPDDLPSVLEKQREKSAAGDSYEIQYRVKHKNGRWVHLEDRGLIVREAGGKAERVIGFSVDITGRRRDEMDRQFLLELGEKIRYGGLGSEELLSEVTAAAARHLDAARCLFIEIDEAADRGTIRHEYCKPGVAPVAGEYKISDYSPQTLAEIKNGHIIVNRDAARDPRTADIFAATYEPYGEHAYVSVPLFTDGRWAAIFWVSDDRPRDWTAKEVSLLETVGERAWLAVERLRNEEALRQNRERLQMAMEAAEIYSWEMDPATGEIVWSGNLEQVIGFPLPGEFGVTLDDLVHPDDRETTRRQILAAIDRNEPYVSEFRIINPNDGEIVWLRGQGILVGDRRGGGARFVGITQNITERKRADEEREELLRREQAARLEAEKANRLKDEFLATVSHELRTPLNAILGWASMALSGSERFGAETTRRAFEVIQRNARNQNQIISDILDVSRIITGKLNLEIQPVELPPIIRAAVETVRPALEAKRLRLTENFEPGRPGRAVLGDSNRLQQVVWNLISNAVKFTPEGGSVEVSLSHAGEAAEIIVRDTGSGIEPEFLPYVFERFRQADAGTNRKHGGLGLGLSIVRHLVEMHGGTVSAESEGAGKGAVFTVRLPLESGADPPSAAFSGKTSANDRREDSGTAPAAEELTRGRRFEGLKILAVDDEADALEIIDVMLSARGAEVLKARSTDEALRRVEAETPDLIISDIGMPGRDGYDFMRAVRRLAGGGATIPAVALTAYARREDKKRALAAGYQAHLAKPIEPEKLLEVVERLARQRAEIVDS